MESAVGETSRADGIITEYVSYPVTEGAFVRGWAIIVLAFAAAGIACGSSSSTTPSPNDFSIAVTSANTNVFLGATEQMTATASDGRVLSGTWNTDTPSVMTVNTTGLATAVSAGLANVFFVAQGRQGTKSMRALPNFAGTFTGNYVVTSCTSTTAIEDALDVCRNAPQGTLVPFTFVFTQVGAILAGNVLILNTPAVPSFSTNIGVGGDASVTGNVTLTGGFVVNTNWTIVQRTPGPISGTITQTVTAPGFLAGQATVTGSISSITRTASVAD